MVENKYTLMKNIKLLILNSILMLGCIEERPSEVSADFTTNKSVYTKGESVVINTSKVKGEFAILFRGDNVKSTYQENPPDSVVLSGFPFDPDLEQVVTGGYSMEGSYTLTIVARSFGQQGNEESKDVSSVVITVEP